jgi:hypothetical protein
VVRESSAGSTSISARFKQFDSSAIRFARLSVHQLAPADTSGRVLIADSTGNTSTIELGPGRYLLVARAIGFGPRRDTIEVAREQSLKLTFSLSLDQYDRCGLPEIRRRP